MPPPGEALKTSKSQTTEGEYVIHIDGRSKKWRSWSLACRPSLPCHGASWAENVDHSRGSLEREKSCLFRRVGGVQRKVCLPPPYKAEVFFVCSVRECVKQASVTSFDAMQPSGCRGVQAGRQAEAGCSCALRWHQRPPGFARSRGGAARHLKQSVCCGVLMVSSKLRCAGPMGRREVVRGHARQRVRHR
eukprot:scaffold2499_cov129-Isochrysis_galbana.AAC.10